MGSVVKFYSAGKKRRFCCLCVCGGWRRRGGAELVFILLFNFQMWMVIVAGCELALSCVIAVERGGGGSLAY